MKKFFCVALTACLLLTGCGDDESKTVDKTSVDKSHVDISVILAVVLIVWAWKFGDKH